MKSIDFKSVLIGVFMASTILLSIGAADPDPSRAKLAKESGKDRYTPTKLEWLELRMKATLSSDFPRQLGVRGFGIGVSMKTPNTIVILCPYRNTADREVMNDQIRHTRDMLLKLAKQKGWNWLKLEDKLIPVDRRPVNRK